MKTFAQFRQQAVFLRESSGSTNIEKTLLKALKVLKLFNVPHYVCGDFAVQERGYPRFTVDVDIIVPDVEFAIEKLSLNGFKQNHGSKMTVTDRETKVEVDLLPGGRKVDPGPLALPMPTQVSDKPQVLTLEKLISSKLSTYMGRGIDRSQDYADVVQLVKANRLSRNFGVDAKVRDEYHKIWDALHQPDKNV
ncbi:MAG: nucleotidyl transferase AbiEii/AbiGii toxin family protein [Bryobacterales bacterium]|nr:nucleotidyl transferase AbiEii/AbiGii toxin family protein [Bryobacterales bacterium]